MYQAGDRIADGIGNQQRKQGLFGGIVADIVSGLCALLISLLSLHRCVAHFGVANSEELRTDQRAVHFVRQFAEAKKPIAAIYHGPSTLIEADAARGKKLTSWPSLRIDLKNAGADWVDQMVVVDRGLITSRKPDDLLAFCEKMLEQFGGARRLTA